MTLQESVMKMPIRYSLSSIKEENKPERQFYTNLNTRNDQTRKETPQVDMSLDSDCLDSKSRVVFTTQKQNN